MHLNWGFVKALCLQVAILLGLIAIVMMIANTAFVNLGRLGVQSGFDFLWQRAGFDISQKLFAYSSSSPIYMAFAIAICNTLLLTVLTIILSTLIGLAVAICRVSDDWFLNGLGTAYVETFRNIPALLQIFLLYYVVLRALPGSADSIHILNYVFINNRGLFLPGIHFSQSPLAAPGAVALCVAPAVLSVIILYRRRNPERLPLARWLKFTLAGAWTAAFLFWAAKTFMVTTPKLGTFGYTAGWTISPELCAMILGLSIYNASYIAEVIRAGIRAVPVGQKEAARSLGLGPLAIMRYVVFPQALRVIIPPMTNCYLNVFKASSLGAAVGYPEIISVLVGTTNNLVGRPVEIMFITLCIYASISLFAAWVMSRQNARSNRFMPAQ